MATTGKRHWLASSRLAAVLVIVLLASIGYVALLGHAQSLVDRPVRTFDPKAWATDPSIRTKMVVVVSHMPFERAMTSEQAINLLGPPTQQSLGKFVWVEPAGSPLLSGQSTLTMRYQVRDAGALPKGQISATGVDYSLGPADWLNHRFEAIALAIVAAGALIVSLLMQWRSRRSSNKRIEPTAQAPYHAKSA